MPSPWRSRTSAPTPASRSPSGRRAEPCSSPRRPPASPALEYAPAAVKQAVCGYGRADKEQVRRMVKAILGLDELPHAEPRRRRARGRDLPRARAAAPARRSRRDRPAARHAPARVGRGLVLDVSGVGYLVAATPRVTRASGEEVTVETYLTSARTRCSSTASRSAEERELFELLLGVPASGRRSRSRSSPARRRPSCAARSRART